MVPELLFTLKVTSLRAAIASWPLSLPSTPSAVENKWHKERGGRGGYAEHRRLTSSSRSSAPNAELGLRVSLTNALHVTSHMSHDMRRAPDAAQLGVNGAPGGRAHQLRVRLQHQHSLSRHGCAYEVHVHDVKYVTCNMASLRFVPCRIQMLRKNSAENECRSPWPSAAKSHPSARCT